MANWDLTKSFNFEGHFIKWDKKGKGQPVVLIHGTPWSSFNLRHLINGLATHYEVYFYDLLGYGQSAKPNGDVSLAIQNQLLVALLDYWNLEKPFIIGHDFGGTTVLRTHLLHQRPFQKMVVINPVAISPWGSSFFSHVKKYEMAFAGVPDHIHEAILKAYLQTAAYHTIEPETMKAIIQPWLGTEGKAAFYRQIAQANSKYTDEIQPRYSNIQTPTLILWGAKDEWIPVEKGHQLHELISNSVLEIILDAGHLVIEEQPKILIDKILHFLKQPTN